MTEEFTQEFIDRQKCLLSGYNPPIWSHSMAISALETIERLNLFEKLFKEWIEKTDWIQQIEIIEKNQYKFAGMHRADCIRTILDDMKESLEEIIRWEDAYPLDMFPEEDIEKAREILKEHGISLTNLMVHGMRHVVTRCAEIARKAME
jgi:hypothetical protein